MSKTVDLTNDFDDEWDEDVLNDIAGAEASFTESVTEESPQPKHLEFLNRIFGHKAFRPMQWKIISSIIHHKRDNCAVMSTGYGKSLCFQFPSAFTGGVTFVISPLISLMSDQVLALTVANIPACLLGTANTEQAKTIKEIENNKYRLVYLTPEFCGADTGRDLLSRWSKTLPVTLIAIDEAHCVSSWGHDFRGQYRNLGSLRDVMPDIPILAVTATATEKVRDDIVRSLKLRNPQLSSTSFDRPNFYFAVHKKTDCVEDLKKVMQCNNQQWRFSGSTIIYCTTRKKTDELARILEAIGVKCAPYHAGLSLAERKHAHEDFVRDKLEVVVATIAFGMGIDKPDVRNVIHYGVSDSIESYYQESGRAGRDGQPANCICFYEPRDFSIHAYLRAKTSMSDANRKRKEEMMLHVEDYVGTGECRRKFILNYFEENIDTSKLELCCDNCLKSKISTNNCELYEDLDENSKYNFTEDARQLLSVVDAMSGRFGLNSYVDFLRGSARKQLSNYHTHPLHGSGKSKSQIWWKELGNLLTRYKFLAKTASTYNQFTLLLKMTDAGKDFLSNSKKEFIAPPTQDMLKCLKTKGNIWLSKDVALPAPVTSSIWNTKDKPPPRQVTSTSTSMNNGHCTMNSGDGTPETQEQLEQNMQVYRMLCNKRTKLATSEGCMPYMVASTKALMDMAKLKPQNLQEMEAMQFDGFTAAKLEKFGEAFLEVIPVRKTVPVMCRDQRVKLSILEQLQKCHLPDIKDNSINDSAKTSLSLYKLSKNIKEIAETRSMAISTIENHLSRCLKVGCQVTLSTFGINKDIAKTIIDAILEANAGLTILTPIKLLCPEDISFGQIRSLSTYLQIREHLNENRLGYEEFDDPEYYEMYKRLKDQKGQQQEQQKQQQQRDQQKQQQQQRDQQKQQQQRDQQKQQQQDQQKPTSKLDELLKGLETVEKSGITFEDSEDTNFFDDLLTKTCDDLESSVNEHDDVLDDNGEPLLKKSKMDFCGLLDSPPPQNTDDDSNDTIIVEADDKSANAQEEATETHQVPAERENKKILNLPPWIVRKRCV